jgi:hypothetical protein
VSIHLPSSASVMSAGGGDDIIFDFHREEEVWINGV